MSCLTEGEGGITSFLGGQPSNKKSKYIRSHGKREVPLYNTLASAERIFTDNQPKSVHFHENEAPKGPTRNFQYGKKLELFSMQIQLSYIDIYFHSIFLILALFGLEWKYIMFFSNETKDDDINPKRINIIKF